VEFETRDFKKHSKLSEKKQRNPAVSINHQENRILLSCFSCLTVEIDVKIRVTVLFENEPRFLITRFVRFSALIQSISGFPDPGHGKYFRPFSFFLPHRSKGLLFFLTFQLQVPLCARHRMGNLQVNTYRKRFPAVGTARHSSERCKSKRTPVTITFYLRPTRTSVVSLLFVCSR
jgi:hypothetical protein